MIRYIENKDIDYEKWDSCIQTAMNENIYAQSYYLDLACEDWHALVENNYESVMPLCVKNRMGISYIIQPPFSQQHGVFSSRPITEEKIKEFLQQIPQSYRFINIHLNADNPIQQQKSIAVLPHKNLYVNLRQKIETIRKSYSTNHKRNIKKAAKNNLSILLNQKPDDLITLYLQGNGKRYPALTENEIYILKRLIYSSIYRGQGISMGVYSPNNTLCAGCFLLFSKRNIFFIFSGYNEAGRQYSAMHFMIDAILEKFSLQDYTFQFEGSDNPSLYRFYKGFGAIEEIYRQVKMMRFPLLLKPFVRLYLRYR